MLDKVRIAILTTTHWGKRIARNLYNDRRFPLVSLIANFPDDSDEIWDYANNTAKIQLKDDDETNKEEIDEILVEHGLVSSMGEIEGGGSSTGPDNYKKTVDIAIVDLGRLSLNEEVVRRLKKHVSIKVVVLAAMMKEKGDLEEMGAFAVCPVIDGYGAADTIAQILEELARARKK